MYGSHWIQRTMQTKTLRQDQTQVKTIKHGTETEILVSVKTSLASRL